MGRPSAAAPGQGTGSGMKATIERATLLKALGHVQSVVERRNTIPILSNVLIEAKDDGSIRLMATDLDLQVDESVAAQVDQAGAVEEAKGIAHRRARDAEARGQDLFVQPGARREFPRQDGVGDSVGQAFGAGQGRRHCGLGSRHAIGAGSACARHQPARAMSTTSFPRAAT